MIEPWRIGISARLTSRTKLGTKDTTPHKAPPLTATADSQQHGEIEAPKIGAAAKLGMASVGSSSLPPLPFFVFIDSWIHRLSIVVGEVSEKIRILNDLIKISLKLLKYDTIGISTLN